MDASFQATLVKGLESKREHTCRLRSVSVTSEGRQEEKSGVDVEGRDAGELNNETNPTGKIQKSDLKILDESGQVKVEIKGFQAVEASQEEFLKRLAEQRTTSADDYFYELQWREKPLERVQSKEGPQQVQVNSAPKKWVIFTDKQGVGEALSQAIRKAGNVAIPVRAQAVVEDSKAFQKVSDFAYSLNPNRAEAYENYF